MSRLPVEQIIAPKASNYARWVNFPWLVVEPEGQTKAGDWSAIDQSRLEALVTRAHAQNLWIRFYTLDGFLNGDGDGLTPSYDFGSDAAVKVRSDDGTSVRAQGRFNLLGIELPVLWIYL